MKKMGVAPFTLAPLILNFLSEIDFFCKPAHNKEGNL